jgi:hypothetical protein
MTHEPTWTETIPTSEGHYWILIPQERNTTLESRIIEVKIIGLGKDLYAKWANKWVPLVGFRDAMWSGPIQEPTEK